VIQGRHTQLFIPPSGVEVVAPVEDVDPSQMARGDTDEDGIATLPPATQQECAKLVAPVRAVASAKQLHAGTLARTVRDMRERALSGDDAE